MEHKLPGEVGSLFALELFPPRHLRLLSNCQDGQHTSDLVHLHLMWRLVQHIFLWAQNKFQLLNIPGLLNMGVDLLSGLEHSVVSPSKEVEALGMAFELGS